MPSLARILEARKEDTPQIFFYHGYTGIAVMYPEKLDDAKNFSPELIIDWADMISLNISLDIYRD